ncbi:LuxR family transcriptional regulator [Paenarthrobacter sp. PH39-S1]|uniref:LuxR C-terminal-related transcriptional regulator n=1 Tax=Paenarthrobacter sp. PH39-S1 TaxID=3046204 RepID=UPI0024B930C5|nr:LuxR family transcriptional regulator [Paenarthrobacter sp. PH39-S1]
MGSAREAEIAALRQFLADPDNLGVLVTGEAGVGKSAFARACLGQSTDNHPVYFRGEQSAKNIPYGYLGFMLARVPPKALDDPMCVIQGIAAAIREDAGGKPVYLVLDNVQFMDEMSTAVILHLVASGTVRLIVLATDASLVPPDLLYFLDTGQLVQLDLDPFTLQQTKTILHGTLGHYVGSGAAAVLYSLSRGNSRVLSALTSEQQRTGNLVLRGETWVLKEMPTFGGNVEDLFKATWARADEATREVIEVLALARRLPLDVAMDMFGAAELSWMEDDGLINIEGATQQWVALRDHYVADIVRRWVPAARSRELHARIVRELKPDMSAMNVDDLLAHAAWTQDCGAALEPDTALAAARLAVQLYNPQFALRTAANIPRLDPLWVAGQEVKAAGHLLLSDANSAVRELRDVSSWQLDALRPAEYVGYIVALCDALMPGSGGTVEVLAVLQAARARMAAWRTGADPRLLEELERGAHRLEIVEFEVAVFLGDYAAIAARLEEIYRSDSTDVEYRLSAGSLLAEAWALTGRELDAIALIGEVSSLIGTLDCPPFRRDRLGRREFLCRFFLGRWEECVRMLAGAMSGPAAKLQYRGGQAELFKGLAWAYAGRANEALEPLLGAVAQLELRSGNDHLYLAYAVTAYAYAQLGDRPRVLQYLARMGTCTGPYSWLARSLAENCALMARLWTGDPNAAATLIRSAQVDIARGLVVSAGIALMGASVAGSEEVERLIEETANRRQGTLADIGTLFVAGNRAKDPRPFLKAADLAQSLRLDSAEAKFTAHAVELARQRGDRATVRAAQHRLDTLQAILPMRPVVHTDGSLALTGREREIGLLAGGGASNKDIALALDVSIRTVEGHLYQIFAKLNVKTRGELVGRL